MAKLKQKVTVKLVDTTTNEEISYNTTTEPKKSTWGNSYFGTLNSRGIAKLQAKGYNIDSEEDWCNFLKQTYDLTDDDIGDRGAKWDTTESRERYKVYINGAEFSPAFTEKQVKREQAVIHSAPKIPSAQINAPSIPQPQPTPIPTPQPATPTPTPIPSVPQVPTMEVPQPEVSVPKAPTISVPLPPINAIADTTQIVIPMPTQPQVSQPVLNSVEQGYLNAMKGHIATNKFSKEQLVSSLGAKIGNEKAEEIYKLAL